MGMVIDWNIDLIFETSEIREEHMDRICDLVKESGLFNPDEFCCIDVGCASVTTWTSNWSASEEMEDLLHRIAMEAPCSIVAYHQAEGGSEYKDTYEGRSIVHYRPIIEWIQSSCEERD